MKALVARTAPRSGRPARPPSGAASPAIGPVWTATATARDAGATDHGTERRDGPERSSISANLKRTWKDGQESSTGVSLGFKQDF